MVFASDEDAIQNPVAATMPGMAIHAVPSLNLSPKGIAGPPGDPAQGGVVPPVPNWDKLRPKADASTAEPSTFRGTPATGRSVAAELPGSARPEEVSYEGPMLGNQKHGFGRLRLESGQYEGEFINDLKHGQGVLSWDDGRQYEGDFRNGRFHGAGSMAWPDGRTYYGQYEEDRKHGDGIFAWPDGRRYQGNWQSGKRHGIGTYTNAKGCTRAGVWDSDRPLRWEIEAPGVAPALATPERSDYAATPRSFV